MQTKLEEYCRLLKKIKDLANKELDRFVATWTVSGLAPLFSEDKLASIKRQLKVRTRNFLTQIDSIKD